MAAPELEPQRPETGVTGTQENPKLEVRGRKSELNGEGRSWDWSWALPSRGGTRWSRLEVWWEERSVDGLPPRRGKEGWGVEKALRCGRGGAG